MLLITCCAIMWFVIRYDNLCFVLFDEYNKNADVIKAEIPSFVNGMCSGQKVLFL